MEYSKNRYLIPLYLAYKLLLLTYAFDLYMNVEPEMALTPLGLFISVIGIIIISLSLFPSKLLMAVTVFTLMLASYFISEYTDGDAIMKYFFGIDANYRILPFWDLCYLYIGVFILILEPFSFCFFKEKKLNTSMHSLLDESMDDDI